MSQAWDPNLPAPSDFRDLVDVIIKLDADSIRTLDDLMSLSRRHDRLPPDSSEQRDIAAQMVSMANGLEHQYQELDTHYGWVLASDHALVNKVLRSYLGENERVEYWLITVTVLMENTRSTLRAIVAGFGEGSVE
jgi:hypothetical protein